MLEDPHPRVRAEAERCLARHADPELVKRLVRRLADGSLKEQSFAEKRRVCTMLGSFGGPREVRLLKELVQRGRVLGGRRQVELCAAAAHGLAATDDRVHLELLEQTAGRRLMARQVRDACREAAEVLRSGRRSRSSQVQPVPELSRPPEPVAESAADGAGPQPRELEDRPAARLHHEAPREVADQTGFGGTEDYGFVDLGADGPIEGDDRTAQEGQPAPQASGEVEQLLRAYLDQPADAVSDPDTDVDEPDAVARLLQSYLEDVGDPAPAEAPPTGVDELLRRYVEEDEP